MDLLEELPAGRRVIDFKTGGVKSKSDIEKKDKEGRMSTHLRQLAMYAYLLGGQNILGRLEYLESANADFYEKEIGAEEIELLKKEIKEYDTALKKGELIVRECHFNSYGRKIECAYCQLAEVYA